MSLSTKVALVANKITLRAAERSTNAKLTELEEKGYKIVSIQTSAHPVPDDIDKSTLRLLWLSVVTYLVDESKTINKDSERIIVYETKEPQK